MADSTILPIYRHRLVQPDGTTTPEFYRFFQALERLQQSSDTALQDQITQIAFKLGSPDGTVGNIPFVDISDFLTSASNVVGNASIASFGALASGVVVLTLVNDVADPTGGTPGTTFYYGVDQTGAKGWYPLDGDHVLLESLGGATYTTLQEFVNVMHSPGLITGGAITDLGAGNIRVLAGTIMVRIADDDVSTLTFADFDQTDFVIPADQDTRFFGVVYNAGTPIVEVRTVFDWDKDTEIPLGSAVRFNGTTILLSNAYKTGDPITNIIQRFDAIGPAQRDNAEGGLLLGETGTRNVTLSAGRIWARLTDFGVTAKNSSVDTMVSGFFDGVSDLVLTTGVTQWDNLQYNDTTAGTLVTLDNNKYANLWFFIATEGDQYGFIYGTNQYNTLAAASTEGVPFFLTTNFFAQTLLLGRLIFQKSAATASVIESAFTRVFTTQPVSDHNQLTNLQGGTAPSEFFHLTSSQHTDLSNLAALGVGIPTHTGADTWANVTVGNGLKLIGTTLSAGESGTEDATTFMRGDGVWSNALTDSLLLGDVDVSSPADRLHLNHIGTGQTAIRWSNAETLRALVGVAETAGQIISNSTVGDLLYRTETVMRWSVGAVEGMRFSSASGQVTLNLIGASSRANIAMTTASADGDNVIAGTETYHGGPSTSGSAESRVALLIGASDGATVNNRGGRFRVNLKNDNSSSMTDRLEIRQNGNIGVSGSSYGGGSLVRFFANATVIPTSNPAGGFIEYGSGGGAFVRTVGGNIVNYAPNTAPSVTGSRGGNAALASLLTQLASLGFIVDNTTA